MMLEYFNFPYTFKVIEILTMKKEPYESINPNGRMPAVQSTIYGHHAV